MFRTRKVPTQIKIFGNVRCPILRIITNSTPQCWCSPATDILKKSRLNWKLKILNAADNADITQSQARDTRRSICVSSHYLSLSIRLSARVLSFYSFAVLQVKRGDTVLLTVGL